MASGEEAGAARRCGARACVWGLASVEEVSAGVRLLGLSACLLVSFQMKDFKTFEDDLKSLSKLKQPLN